MKSLSRKQFLKLMGASFGALATSGLPFQELLGQSTYGNTLINLLLEGGPDFRHLFVPKPSSDTKSYGYKFWNNRTTAIGKGTAVSDPASWNTAFANNYEAVSLKDSSGNTIEFGILKTNNSAEGANTWLIEQIKAGKVAIINNVYHSISRDHPHSLLVLQSGIYETKAGQSGQSGWGGRLIETLSDGRLLSLSNQPRAFCNTSQKSKLLSFTNSRNFGLSQASVDTNGRISTNDRGIRALNAYYSQRASQYSGTVYEKFFNQQIKLQSLSTQIRARLSSGSSLAETYSALGMDSGFFQTDANGQTGFKTSNFRTQILSLYDAFVVSDLLKPRIFSLNYNYWDSHKNQQSDIEPQLNDIFGYNRGFHAVFKNNPAIFNSSVIVISGEFGRQLKSNGDLGTDHGRGNTVLVIGGQVVGGIYGEMFPTRESTEDASGKAPLDMFNRDIQGRTAFHKVFGKVCDWVNPGSSSTVFNETIYPLPTMKDDTGSIISSTGIESGVSLSFL